MECPSCHCENPDDSRFCSRCGTSLIEMPATPPTAATTQRMQRSHTLGFTPGQHFGQRYQIVEEIGRGGMGVVYKAIDMELNRIVALKMIKPDLGGDPRVVEQFKNELLLAREVTHENVIRIHDLGEADGIRYISMKYIDGSSLSDLLSAAGRLTAEKAIGIALQICRALAAAHRQNVIHRDLKPQNIMLDRRGNAYVMDFGIARSLASSAAATQGSVTGTPNYMSPEQAKGVSGDARSDIYSLGCILYEMVTGQRPFSADSLEGLIRCHIDAFPRPPSEVSAHIPASLEAVIMKCLRKDPPDRYQSAHELHAELEKLKTDRSRGAEATHAAPSEQVKPKEKASIAVLPFRDMSPKKDQEYFCDGMAEELTNALVKVEGLRVAALTSAFQFRDRGIDVREIGNRLSVNSVLEGSVRKAGNKLRVTAQLVNVTDGYHLWSERYDRDMDDIFAIQDEISEAIVSALRLRLVDSKGERIECCGTRNAEAYNLYLKGRYYWNKRIPSALRRSIEYYEQAIQLDPDYALAYAGLADTYIMLDQVDDANRQLDAKQAALRALSLDETLAEPHATLGWVAFGFEYDHETSEKEFRRAIELNPNYATAHQWYALYLLAHGRFDEAYEQMGIAKDLDPVSLIIMAAAGWLYHFTGRYDDAVSECMKALEMDPNFAPAHMVLGETYMRMGKEDDAVKEYIKVFELFGATDIAGNIETAFKDSGYRAAIRVVIDAVQRREPREFNSPIFAARLWAILGEMEEAFAALEQAYEMREGELIIMLRVKEFQAMRSDPRFQDLARRLGLAD